MRSLELTEEEFDSLLIILGYAAGAAMNKGDRQLAASALTMADRIGENNPNWRPYTTKADA